MGLTNADIQFFKSVTITDTTANGGKIGLVPVIARARQNLFPRVSKADRITGITRYRKEGLRNNNASGIEAAEVHAYMMAPSNGGDRFAIAKGTQTDTQNDLTDGQGWVGVGALNTALSGSETSVIVDYPSNDVEFIPGGVLVIHNAIKTGQTVNANAKPGDSVEYSGGEWTTISATTNITYPVGLLIDDDIVLTEEAGQFTNEYVALPENLTEGESIGTGDGSTTNPTLSTLTTAANGIVGIKGYAPVVTATCGGTARTVTVAHDGTCSGYCSAGQLNMATGAWTTPITWTTAPDNATSITCTYRNKFWTWSSNTVTITTSGQVANAYATTNTYIAGALYVAELSPSADSVVIASTSGTYDDTTYPIALGNKGAVEDTIRLTFTSATAFTATLLSTSTSLGSGTIAGDFAPTNPDSETPYLTIDADGWGGTWAAADTMDIPTHPPIMPIWWREIVPAGTAAEPDNITAMGWSAE